MNKNTPLGPLDITAKSFLVLYPDGSSKTGRMGRLDAPLMIAGEAELLAATKILDCEAVVCLELTLRRTDGVYVANLYFDRDGESKGLAPSTRVEDMLLNMHDQTKAPLPKLDIRLFGPVVLVPVGTPKPSSVVLH